MKLMNQYPNFNDNSSSQEVYWIEFLKAVGQEFIDEKFSPILEKTCGLLNKRNCSLIIIKNNFDESYSIYEEETEALLLTILKNQEGKYFFIANTIFQFYCYKILFDFQDEVTGYNLENYSKKFIYEILFLIKDLPDNEKLPDILYYLSVVLINEFNLDYLNSDIMHFDPKFILVNGIKDEFILSRNKISTEKVTYNISLELDSDIIQVTKIYENNTKEIHLFTLEDLAFDLE